MTTEEKKQCARERSAAWRKLNRDRGHESTRLWVEKNKERSAFLKKRWYAKNKAKANAAAARWYLENTPRVLSNVSRWQKANRRKMLKYYRDRARNLDHDSHERIKARLAGRIRTALGSTNKCAATLELVGCSVSELKQHIESQFKPGMSWKDRSAWHIDHEIPCRAFDLTDPAEQRRCFHFSNLRPLWATENLSKNDKILVGNFYVSARKIA